MHRSFCLSGLAHSRWLNALVQLLTSWFFPDNLKLHDVFHVSLLRPYHSDGTVQPPPAILIEGEHEYEVDRIPDHKDKYARSKGTTREYLLKWVGYGPEHDTWEPEVNLLYCQDLLKKYWATTESSASMVPEKVLKQRTRKRSGQT